MNSAQFKLDKFEGPLDLLLHLIGKHKLNIYDIEISLLLEQYLDYIENLDHDDFEGAADFLEMAARLIYIKTCQLLPHDEEAPDLKKELEGRIIEYSLCRLASKTLRERYAGGEIFVRNPIKLPVNRTYSRQHDPQELYRAYMGLSEKARRNTPLKANMFEPIVSHRIVSVTSKIIFVLKRLYIDGECSLEHLYDGMNDKSERVATFLAVLELTKSGRIFLNDNNTNIYFNKKSKRKRINSDFDDENYSSDNVYMTENQNESEIENSGIVPFNRIETDNFAPKPEYKSFCGYKSKKSKLKHAVSCAVEISDIKILNDSSAQEDIFRFDKETSEQSEDYNGILYQGTTCNRESLKTEPVCDKSEKIGLLRHQNVVFADISENRETESIFETKNKDIDNARFVYQHENLPMLSKEPPKNLFKPNFWNSVRYYWGYSLTGGNGRNNYWRFG